MAKIDLLEQIKKASTGEKIKNLPAVTNWFSTGCTVLDLAISNKLPGGVPVGRIIHCYGGSSTCKSVLASTISGNVQRQGGKVYFDDVEHTLDPAFAEYYGLDCEDTSFNLLHSASLEELFDVHIKDIVEDKKLAKIQKVLCVDSITALPSEVELGADMAKGTYGTSRAKQMGIGLRKYLNRIANNNMTLFCIDQSRDNISGYGEKEVTSGGRGLEFYASTRIYLKSDGKIVNSSDKVIGIWVRFTIKKNKVGIPLREGRFKILFDYGLDDIASNLYFLSESQNGIAKAKGKTALIEFKGEQKKMSTWIKQIETDNLEEELRQEVAKLWKKLYQSEDRKPRKWEK